MACSALSAGLFLFGTASTNAQSANYDLLIGFAGSSLCDVQLPACRDLTPDYKIKVGSLFRYSRHAPFASSRSDMANVSITCSPETSVGNSYTLDPTELEFSDRNIVASYLEAQIKNKTVEKTISSIAARMVLQIDDVIAEKADDAQLVALLKHTDSQCRSAQLGDSRNIVSARLHGVTSLRITLNLSLPRHEIESKLELIGNQLRDFELSFDREIATLIVKPKHRVIFAIRKRSLRSFERSFPHLFYE